jgi:hypothetical protein
VDEATRAKRAPILRTAGGIILAAGAAYALSFAADLFLGGWLGLYPSTVHVPLVTWTVIGWIALAVAHQISGGSLWLSIPFAVLAALVLLAAVVGSHAHNYAIAGFLLVIAVIVWRIAPRPDAASDKVP